MTIGLQGYSYTRTLRMKKVAVYNNMKASPLETPLKRMCSDEISLNSDTSSLETLPQDVLVQVMCGVDYEDLKKLFRVSKTIKEATLLAKELHFEYNTPKKNIFAFLNPCADEFREIEPPNTPLTRKSKSRFNKKKLEDISLALFDFMNEEECMSHGSEDNTW